MSCFRVLFFDLLLRGKRDPVTDNRMQGNTVVKFNLLTPNVNYSGRTAPLTSKVAFYMFIQQI